jgi:hypothetical protein
MISQVVWRGMGSQAAKRFAPGATDAICWHAKGSRTVEEACAPESGPATSVAGPSASQAAVFVLTLPLEAPGGYAKTGKAKRPIKLAPTLNEYNGMKPWVKSLSRQAVDRWIHDQIQVAAAKAGSSTLDYAMGCLTARARRRIVVTRYSSRQPDEIACDIIGGKIPIDRLVKAGVLAGDSAKWLEREARWVRCKPGEGKLVVEIFEC